MEIKEVLDRIFKVLSLNDVDIEAHNDKIIISLKQEKKENKKNENIIRLQNHKPLTAYVDGSYNNKKNISGSGLVITDGNEMLKEYQTAPEEYSSLRNVAGELLAVLRAIDIAKNLNAPSLDIYYDYQGIEAWVTGAWKAKLEFTQNYRSKVHEAMGSMEINFHKVKAHSNNALNDMADTLAKKAVGL